MFYLTLRYAIAFVPFVIFVIIMILQKHKNWLRFFLITFIWSNLVLNILLYVPFENFYFSFPTYESAYYYSFEFEIYDVDERKNCVFIADSAGGAYINKDDKGRYKVTSPNILSINKRKLTLSDNSNTKKIEISVIYNPTTSQTYINYTDDYFSNSGGSMLFERGKKEITDSMNNKFKIFEINEPYLKSFGYYTVIYSELPDNYCIFVNGIEMRIE